MQFFWDLINRLVKHNKTIPDVVKHRIAFGGDSDDVNFLLLSQEKARFLFLFYVATFGDIGAVNVCSMHIFRGIDRHFE